MEETESKNTIEEIKEYVSQIDAAQVPVENIDELEKLLARIKELAASPEHKEEIERQAEYVRSETTTSAADSDRQNTNMATETPISAEPDVFPEKQTSADTEKHDQPPEGNTVPHKETSETVAQSQYEDFFTLRDNTSYNFRHNLSVYCRKEANSPLDALQISKEIIGRMSKEDQVKTKRLLNSIKKENETINELLVRTYLEAVKEVPLNEQYIKDRFPDKKIVRPFYDTVTEKGQLLDPDSTLKVGDPINNVAFNVDKLYGFGKDRIFTDLTVVSSTKEGNTVVLMDKNKSFYEVPRDELLISYNEQQTKIAKQDRKQRSSRALEIER